MLTVPTRLLKGRFTGLTIVLMIVLFLVSVVGDRAIREVLVDIGFSVLLLSAVLSAGRRLRIVTLALAAPTFVGHWSIQLTDSLAVRATGFAFTTAFLGFLTLVLLFAVFRDQTVTSDTIVGAVCAYLLIGVTCGTAYALIVLINPNSLSVSAALSQASGWGAARVERHRHREGRDEADGRREGAVPPGPRLRRGARHDAGGE